MASRSRAARRVHGAAGRVPLGCAPTSVHVRRIPRSRSPDRAFNFTGMRTGPSPRVRGSRGSVANDYSVIGSIPACAGKPRSRPRCRSRPGVHPRVCGEAPPYRSRPPADRGPSPRVRGSPRNPAAPCPRPRSIPACAGKPRQRRRSVLLVWVHPRVCGEAVASQTFGAGVAGPSPRVRGSHLQLLVPGLRRGSIPACAGKPPTSRPSCRSSRVHPRVCGEASAANRSAARPWGPSPRVRGSPLRPALCMSCQGSIPACAGKPRSFRKS